MSVTDPIAAAACRHNLSASGVRALADAIRRGGGRSAQWNHPDLGGMGQWSGGGMIQIGDMFNNDLKARVGGALHDLSQADLGDAGASRLSSTWSMAADNWWPGELGQPSSTGAQNDMRYACFPDMRRLAVRRDGKVTVYDTGTRRLTGFSQSQGGAQSLDFSGPDGSVTLGDLKTVG